MTHRQNNKIAALRLVFIYEELHIVDISTVINYYPCDTDLIRSVVVTCLLANYVRGLRD